MVMCQCKAGEHWHQACTRQATWRWHFQRRQILPGEPGHIDLCEPCVHEWMVNLKPAHLHELSEEDEAT